jgi:hypothetical protein
VPQGREHEWTFATRDGARSLAAQAGVDRIIVVSLGTGAVHAARFATLAPAAVQKELMPVLRSLVPKEIAGGPGRRAPSIPILAVSDELGLRTIVAEGSTALSGAFTVEEVPDDEDDDEDEEEEAEAKGGQKAKANAGGKASAPSEQRALRRLIFMSNRAAIQSEVAVRIPASAASTAGAVAAAGTEAPPPRGDVNCARLCFP